MFEFITNFWYHVRFAWRLYMRDTRGMTIGEAWEYPYNPSIGNGNPFENADEELALMYE